MIRLLLAVGIVAAVAAAIWVIQRVYVWLMVEADEWVVWFLFVGASVGGVYWILGAR